MPSIWNSHRWFALQTFAECRGSEEMVHSVLSNDDFWCACFFIIVNLFHWKKSAWLSLVDYSLNLFTTKTLWLVHSNVNLNNVNAMSCLHIPLEVSFELTNPFLASCDIIWSDPSVLILSGTLCNIHNHGLKNAEKVLYCQKFWSDPYLFTLVYTKLTSAVWGK